MDALDVEIDVFSRLARARLARDPAYIAVQAIPGIGPTLGAVFVAEIGDISRFPAAPHLACWAGLTPRHHESDNRVRRGPITKQGSRLVRWAAVESVQTLPATSKVGHMRDRIAVHRGRLIQGHRVLRPLRVLGRSHRDSRDDPPLSRRHAEAAQLLHQPAGRSPWIRNLDGKYTAITKADGEEEVHIFCDLRTTPPASAAKGQGSR